MAINSRSKGKRGELEASKILREYGFDTRRGVQYNGADGSADVVGIDGIHLEIKRVQHLNIDTAMEQSISDAREGETPVVMHRKDRRPWLVTMRLEEWIKLYKGELIHGKNRNNAQDRHGEA